jgi:hypothetical protein
MCHTYSSQLKYLNDLKVIPQQHPIKTTAKESLEAIKASMPSYEAQKLRMILESLRLHIIGSGQKKKQGMSNEIT